MKLYDWCIQNNKEYLLKEWDYTMNTDITPYTVAPFSQKSAYWKCVNGHSWVAVIANRTRGTGCKQCLEEKNTIPKVRPELLNIWDYELNYPLQPDKVTIYSSVIVKWRCKKCSHRWQTKVMYKESDGCPVCTGHTLKTGVNDLETWCRVNKKLYLLELWDYKKNKNLTPKTITYGNGKEVFWYCNKCNTGWKAPVNRLTSTGGRGCAVCANQAVKKGVNDLATTHPELAKEWDVVKNKGITPYEVIGGDKKYWWKCPIGHSYSMSIQHRKNRINCSVCAKELQSSYAEYLLYYIIVQIFNDAIHNADKNVLPWLNRKSLDIYIPFLRLAIELDGPRHSQKIINSDLDKNSLCSQNNVFLIRLRYRNLPKLNSNSYDIELIKEDEKGIIDGAYKIFDFISQQYNLNINFKNIKIDRGKINEAYYKSIKENSVGHKHPEIVSQWHPIKNGTLIPVQIPVSSNKKVWWLCAKCGHDWAVSPNARIKKGKISSCPVCSNNIVKEGVNDLATTYPNIAKEWHPVKNQKLKPQLVVAGSNKKVWWACSKCNYEWEATIRNRTSNGSGCPYCYSPKRALSKANKSK